MFNVCSDLVNSSFFLIKKSDCLCSVIKILEVVLRSKESDKCYDKINRASISGAALS